MIRVTAYWSGQLVWSGDWPTLSKYLSADLLNLEDGWTYDVGIT